MSMNTRCWIGCALLLMAPCADVFADEATTFEVTPFAGYRFGGEFKSADDSRRTLNDAASYGLVLNLEQTPDAYYEFLYSKQSTQIGGATPVDLSIEYAHIGGIILFGDEGDRVIPYFALTAGATRFNPAQTDLQAATEFSFAVGGGVRVPLATHVALRFDARAFVTLLSADSSIFCSASAGNASCDIRVSGSKFIQGQGLIGVTVAF
jgi:hypothetical protein